MDSLTQFVKWFNLGDSNIELSTTNVRSMSADITHATISSFCDHRDWIGVSELGKPAVLLGLKKLGITLDTLTPARKMNMFFGNAFEAGLIALMRARGLLIHTQTPLDFNGIPGHIDMLVDGCVVEVKTMSEGYFRQFTETMNDDRGYITQLAVYSHCVGAPGVFLCYDKAATVHDDKTPLRLITPPPNLLEERLARAVDVVGTLDSIVCLHDIFEYMEPPAPRAEIYRGNETGNYLIPECMKYTAARHIFYKIEDALNGYKKPTSYIVGINTYDEAMEVLHELGLSPQEL